MANRYGYEKGIHENDINNRGRTESPPHENINRSALDIQPTPQPRQDRVAEETPLLHGQNRQIVTEQNTPWGALLCILVFVALERFCFYVLVGAYLDPHASVLKSNPQVLGPVFVGKCRISLFIQFYCKSGNICQQGHHFGFYFGVFLPCCLL